MSQRNRGGKISFEDIQDTNADRITNKHTFTDHVSVFVECKVISVDDVSQTFDTFLTIHCHYKPNEEQREERSGRFKRVKCKKSTNMEIEGKYHIVNKEEHDNIAIPTVFLDNCTSSRFEEFLTTVRVNDRTKEVWIQYENYCTIYESLELHRFPYDRQFFSIYIHLIGVGAIPWIARIEQADFTSARLPSLTGSETADRIQFEAKNWILVGFKVHFLGIAEVLKKGRISDSLKSDVDRVYNELDSKAYDVCVVIVADRNQSYYRWNYILLSAFLAFGSASVFQISVEAVEERQGLTFTILLALVALKFALSANTPVIGYNTYLDLFLLTWNVILFLIIVWIYLATEALQSSCEDALDEEECIETKSESIHATENSIKNSFILIWIIITLVMLTAGTHKPTLKQTLQKQTQNQKDTPKKLDIDLTPSEHH